MEPREATGDAGKRDILKITAQMAWNRAHRKERKAHAAVAAALRSGKLKRGKCRDCGSHRVHAHHPSYEPENWLDIVWLCPLHHRRAHIEMRQMARAA